MALSERDKGIRGGRRHRERRGSLGGAGEGSRYHRRGQDSNVNMNLGWKSAATSHQDDRTASSPAAAALTPQAYTHSRTSSGLPGLHGRLRRQHHLELEDHSWYGR